MWIAQKLPLVAEKSVVSIKDQREYKTVMVCVDIIFVNSIPFMVSILCNIRFRTVEPLRSTEAEYLLQAVNNICNTYEQGGFKDDWILMDMMDSQFDTL